VILERTGFRLIAEVDSAADLIVATGRNLPDAVVLDLTLTGDLGLRALAGVHAACPDCAVVVVSSFHTMRQAALDAGAHDFVGTADLRALETSLRELASELQIWREGLSSTPSRLQDDLAPEAVGTTDGNVRTNAPAS
jgi:DNA-binding NarL/FixJ family response regulator